MSSYRADTPGAKPYDAARCAIFTATKTPSMQAYCHPDTAISELWLAGIGWAVVILVAGVLYFWQAMPGLAHPGPARVPAPPEPVPELRDDLTSQVPGQVG
jgi:hypothetical protein